MFTVNVVGGRRSDHLGVLKKQFNHGVHGRFRRERIAIGDQLEVLGERLGLVRPEIDLFLAELDEKSNPLKSKGIGELGICGAGASIANAIYNACGARMRDYPITLDKLLSKLPVRT